MQHGKGFGRDGLRVHVARTGQAANEVVIGKGALKKVLQAGRREVDPTHGDLPGIGDGAASGFGPGTDPDAVGLDQRDIDFLLGNDHFVRFDVVIIGEPEVVGEGDLVVEAQVGQGS